MNTTLTKTREAAEQAAEKLRTLAAGEAQEQLAPVLQSIASDTTNLDLHDRVLELGKQELIHGEPLGPKEQLLDRVLRQMKSRDEILEVRRAAIPADQRERWSTGKNRSQLDTEYDCLTRWINFFKLIEHTGASLRAQRNIADPTDYKSREERDWATANLSLPPRYVLVLTDAHETVYLKGERRIDHVQCEISNALDEIDYDDDRMFKRPVAIVDLQTGQRTALKLQAVEGELSSL